MRVYVRVSVCEQERKRETVFKIIMFFFRAKLARPVWRRGTKVVDFMCLFLVIKFFLIFFRLCLSLPCCPCPILTLLTIRDRQKLLSFQFLAVFGSVRFCFCLCMPVELSVRPFRCVQSVFAVLCGLVISNSCNGQAVSLRTPRAMPFLPKYRGRLPFRRVIYSFQIFTRHFNILSVFCNVSRN